MHRIVSWFRKAWLVLAIAAIVILLDQWTKELVRTNIPDYTSMIPIPALGEYFVFEHVHNYGAAFGIFQNQGTLFIVVAVVVTIGILVYVRYLPTDAWLVRLLLGLMLGGAIGNVIDRINQGYVTDFVKMGVPGVYYWPNYNIADSAIVGGVIGLGIYVVVDDIRRHRREKAAGAAVADLTASTSPRKQTE